jgi:hypothetical protein
VRLPALAPGEAQAAWTLMMIGLPMSDTLAGGDVRHAGHHVSAAHTVFAYGFMLARVIGDTPDSEVRLPP